MPSSASATTSTLSLHDALPISADRSSTAGAGLGRLSRGVSPSDLNLLIVTLDTTRADRLGTYGWPQSVTPALDRLAQEGVLFEHRSEEHTSELQSLRHLVCRLLRPPPPPPFPYTTLFRSPRIARRPPAPDSAACRAACLRRISTS